MDKPAAAEVPGAVSRPTEADLRNEAAQGSPTAQYDLGACQYRASLDATRRDRSECRIEAYKWLHLAAGQGYRNALTLCQQVILAMSRGEFDEGNRRAAAFVVRT